MEDQREHLKELAEDTQKGRSPLLHNRVTETPLVGTNRGYGKVFLIGSVSGLVIGLVLGGLFGNSTIIAPAVITALIAGICSILAEYFKEHLKKGK